MDWTCQQVPRPRAGSLLRGDPAEGSHAPAQDDVVVEEVHLDVLQADGLVEALGHQEPEQPAEVRGVEEGDADLFRKALQEREQHRARVLPA